MAAKNRPQPRAKKIKISSRDNWEQILKDVDKNEIPIQVLQCIKVNLKDGTIVEIRIDELTKNGELPDSIQRKLNRQLDELSMYIVDVDFFVDIELLANTVQPITNHLLKKIKK